MAKKNIDVTGGNNNQNSTAITVLKSVNEIPSIMPDMDKKELFNAIQETTPINDLTGKHFKILGLIPEIVEVPRNTDDESGLPFDDDDLVERLRVTLITDQGNFHSFSVTLNKALMKAMNVFQEEFLGQTYEITQKTRGTGKNANNYYLLKSV